MASCRGPCFELAKNKTQEKRRKRRKTQEMQGNAGKRRRIISIYVEYLADAYDLEDGNDTFLLTYDRVI